MADFLVFKLHHTILHLAPDPIYTIPLLVHQTRFTPYLS